MSADQAVAHATMVDGVTTTRAVELYVPRPRPVEDIGHAALDGFTIMEAAKSPWEALRIHLEERIIDQPEAIDSTIDAMERTSVRMPNDKRPIATLAFLGPTGVGKSETAKALAEFLSEDGHLVRVDCSDYAQGFEISRLTGASPNYVGYGQPALLRQENVEKPGTIILFDEIEKGSEKLFNLMLQIMEEGELQLGDGSVTHFRDTLVILTSNLGAREMATQLSGVPFGLAGQVRGTDTKSVNEVAKKSFSNHFKPEFVNRITQLVVFHPLSRDSLDDILDAKLDLKNAEYEPAIGVHLSLSRAAREFLLDLAMMEPHMGARPLIRAMDRHVGTTFGRHYGAGTIPEGTHVKVFHADEVGRVILDGESPLVFASKPDKTFRKQREAVAILPKPTDYNDEDIAEVS